jgi:predicted RNA-binding protein with PUA-like domain
LKQIKADPRFKDFQLVTQSRRSVMPVSAAHWKAICKLGGIEG